MVAAESSANREPVSADCREVVSFSLLSIHHLPSSFSPSHTLGTLYYVETPLLRLQISRRPIVASNMLYIRFLLSFLYQPKTFSLASWNATQRNASHWKKSWTTSFSRRWVAVLSKVHYFNFGAVMPGPLTGLLRSIIVTKYNRNYIGSCSSIFCLDITALLEANFSVEAIIGALAAQEHHCPYY